MILGMITPPKSEQLATIGLKQLALDSCESVISVEVVPPRTQNQHALFVCVDISSVRSCFEICVCLAEQGKTAISRPRFGLRAITLVLEFGGPLPLSFVQNLALQSVNGYLVLSR